MVAPLASDNVAVGLATLAIFIELTVSANLLTLLHVPYVVDGGNLLFKLHPGTHLLAAAFIVLAFRQGGWSLLMSHPMLMTFFCLMVACVIYALALSGTGNVIVLLDTFLPAGLLATILHRAHPGQLRRLRSLMQCLLTLNALLALAEAAAHATFIPLYLNDSPYQPHSEDFRPTALFDHPLTGSIMALLGLALIPRNHWCRWIYTGLMWASLLVYGGRVAMIVAVAVVSGNHLTHTVSMVLRRNPGASRQISAAALVSTAAVLLISIALSMGAGTRMAAHFYWDDSAQTRLAQWQLLARLDVWQWLFGARREDMLALLIPLRLGTGVEVIENFWLLMFVNLGLFGFPLFAAALGALLAWCWRASNRQGRLFLVGVILVASTSNSIGRKSTVLVCIVAAIACMPGRRLIAPQRNARAIDSYRSAVAA